MNIAVIFAGGAGKRMNTRAKPKQILKMHGKPVIIYTLQHFQEHREIDKIVLVCIESWIDYAHKLADKYHIDKLVSIVHGGNTGQESIMHGLQKAWDVATGLNDIVLIHDGVRPLINGDLISRCIDTVKKYGNVITIT